MPKRTGIFVTGTDTGVGKTEVGRAAVALLRDEGLSVSVMKPIETGVGPEGPLDALALREAAGVPDAIDLVCPHQFSLPAAPNVAAADEGRDLDLPLIMSAYETLRDQRDFIWVEGAGGILVPVTDDSSMADLAKALALPVLLVARASLGTINHTLLSLAEIERQSLECVGVVISHSAQQTSEADLKNLQTLRKTLGARLIGELPTLAEGCAAPDGWLRPDALLG
jgi:dethiobiotin synthetase